MPSLVSVASGADLRARRWDAVVLGSGIAGLVAAARLGMAGHRVLVVQEEAAATAFEGLREPFLLAGARDAGVLDACMRELTLPLIDRRRVVPTPIAYQMVGPDLRADLGEGDLTADELVAWGLAVPDEARALVRTLVEAAEAEREVLLRSPVVRMGRARTRDPLRALVRTPPANTRARGLPDQAASPPAALAPVLDAQVRALSNLASDPPPPEARARLLGTPLSGGAGFVDGPPWLSGLLRRRVESLYGEFRTLSGDFSLVTADGLPGIVPGDSRDLWLGRLLVIAAPASALAAVLDPDERPDFLRARPEPRHCRRWVAVHLRVQRSVLPEAMAPRVIVLDGPGRSPLTLSSFANRQEPELSDWVARAVAPADADPAAVQKAIFQRVLELLPFSEGAVTRRPVQIPRWDDDGWLEDPSPGTGWPGESDLRVSTRPPVYRLDRPSVASLGLEGDLLLGWRGGDAIAAALR
ncbi:MAG: FAD-binding protein [Proteobacteria bacterium]|nr:FAD-binding protein [Pseudomonadota bacterium]